MKQPIGIKTIFRKGIALFFFLAILIHGQQDVSVKVTDTDINQLLTAGITARAFNFGDYGETWATKGYFVNLDAATIHFIVGSVQSPARATISATAVYVEVLNDWVPGNAQQPIHGSVTITGDIILRTIDNSSKLNFKATSVDLSLFGIGISASQFVNKLPELELNVGSSLLPDVITSYFTSNIPLLSTGDGVLTVYLTASGPRLIKAYNEVNQKLTVGSIEEVVSGSPLPPVSSPASFWWNPLTTHQLQTPVALLDETNGKNKYKNWFQGDNSSPETDIAPGRFQLSVTNDASYKAKFLKAQHVQLSNVLEGSLSGGTVTYESTTGATYDNYEYYHATQAHPINSSVPNGTLGANWVWRGWSDGNTSQSRNIILNSDVNLAGNYKGHLFTNSANATSSNNQRKIVQSTDGLWGMVYVSSNQIWACRSTDGVNWTNETLISDGDGYVDGYPSISEAGNIASIVWQRLDWNAEYPPFSYGQIAVRTFNLYSGVLGSISQVTSFLPDIEAFTASPVVTGYSDDMMISWREPTGIKVRYYNNYSGWSSIASVPGTNSYSFNPSIAHYGMYASVAALVWEDRYIYNHLIKYTELFPSYSGPWSFSTVTDIAPTNWDNNSSPQFAMASSATKPTVVWSSRYNLAEGSASVHIRQKSSMVNGTWGNITSFTYPTFEDLKPVIGDFYIGAAMDVYWNILNTVYHSSTLNGTSWSAPSIVTTTGGSGVNVNRSALNQTKALWKKPSGNINFTITAISKVAAADDEKIPYRLNRHAIIDISKISPKSSGSLAFEIAWVGLPEENKDKKIDFEHEGNKNLLSSKPFTVTSPGQTLFFAGAVYGSKLVVSSDAVAKIKEPLAKVSIKENKTDKVLQDIWIAPSSMLLSVKDSTFGEYKEITVDLTKYVGKEIYLDVETAGKSKKVAPLFVDDYLFVTNSANANLGKRAATIDDLPTTYALKQNYPNPFNPSTMISYSLPNNTFVTLKVFDVLGNEVATLVNEEKPAGNFEVEFNASGLSSGIYFYRIQTESFVDTKKLIMLK